MPTPDGDAKRIILITGCSSGIGRASAEMLLERGHTVCATARRTESVEDLAQTLKRFGDHAIVKRLDVTEPATGAEVVADLIDRHGRIDILVNNAAYGQMGAIEDLTSEQLRRQYEVNVIGLLNLTNRVIPEMRRAGFGRIVNVSSVAAHVSAPLTGAYNSSKAALNAISGSLRMELAGSGIDTILVEPGLIATSFRENAVRARDASPPPPGSKFKETYDAWLDRWKQRMVKEVTPPSAVAHAIVRAIESRRPRTRYRVTNVAKYAPLVFSLLPDRIADRILARASGLTRARRTRV